MTQTSRTLLAIFLVGLCALATPGAAFAENTAESGAPNSVIAPHLTEARRAKVDQLFRLLKEADNAEEGQAIVARIWEAWTDTGNKDVDALMNQARLAVQEGGIKEAVGALDRVTEIAPDYAEGWNRRATLYFMLGQHAQSVLDIRETLEREPRHFGALSGLAQIYAAAGNWEAALKAFERAAEINPFMPNKEQVLKDLRQKALGTSL